MTSALFMGPFIIFAVAHTFFTSVEYQYNCCEILAN